MFGASYENKWIYQVKTETWDNKNTYRPQYTASQCRRATDGVCRCRKVCVVFCCCSVPWGLGCTIAWVYTISLISSTVLSSSSAAQIWVLVVASICLNWASRSLGLRAPSDRDVFALQTLIGLFSVSKRCLIFWHSFSFCSVWTLHLEHIWDIFLFYNKCSNKQTKKATDKQNSVKYPEIDGNGTQTIKIKKKTTPNNKNTLKGGGDHLLKTIIIMTNCNLMLWSILILRWVWCESWHSPEKVPRFYASSFLLILSKNILLFQVWGSKLHPWHNL